jgi:hypothetical protein
MDTTSGTYHQGIYLYCFTRPGTVSDRADVETLVVQDVAVVLARVPLADWEGPAAEARLSDSNWLIPRALAHEHVIESQMAQSPVLPVRFGAVFSGEAALVEFVTARAAEISEFLDRIADLEEWAVKGFLNPSLTEQWLEANEPGLAERRQHLSDSPGARYFQEKRLKADLQKLSRQWAHSLTETLSAELKSSAVDACTLRYQPAAGADQEMVFHVAFLLPIASVSEFRDQVAQVQVRYAVQGLTLEMTGPWPPWNFCPALAKAPA